LHLSEPPNKSLPPDGGHFPLLSISEFFSLCLYFSDYFLSLLLSDRSLRLFSLDLPHLGSPV
jgi:hypothetical protein